MRSLSPSLFQPPFAVARGRLRARPARQRQRGIALVIVIVLALTSALLALWGFRSSVLNEAVVGNDADYLRAFEAAQALMQDAEYDIRGQRPDGKPCDPVSSGGSPNLDVCRPDGATVWFIQEDKELGNLIATLGGQATGCLKGICIKRTGVQDFWKEPDTLEAMIADNVGARYGQFTGANSGSASNPILAERAEGRGGWYWVEVLPYDTSPGGGLVIGKSKLALNLKPSLAYRITALARGLKPGTQVVLQSTYVQRKLQD